MHDRSDESTRLAEFLQQSHNVTVSSVALLDQNVYKVDLDDTDRTTWVARVFRAPDAYASTKNLVNLLEHVLSHKFPAERPISPTAVSIFPETNNGPTESNSSESALLLTHFVGGTQPARSRVLFAKMGKLLARLHSLPVPESIPRGGAWHHLCLAGDFGDECAEADRRLQRLAEGRPEHQEMIEQLRRNIDEFKRRYERASSKLPTAISHPDFVPVNLIAVDSSTVTVIDWAAAGVSPRVWALGRLLGSAASKGKMEVLDATLKGYTEGGIELCAEEIEVIGDAATGKRVTILAWEVTERGKDPEMALSELNGLVEFGRRVQGRAKEVLGL